MLHSVNVFYYSLQGQCCSTGDATQYVCFLLFLVESVELQQLYRRCYTARAFPTISCRATKHYRRCYTVCTFPRILCRATVALHKMLQSECVSYYSLQGYSSSTRDVTQRPRFLRFPVELQQLHRRCYTVCTFPTIPCGANVVRQEILHNMCVSYYSLQSYSSLTGDASQCRRFLLFPVGLLQLHKRCYTVCASSTIPCRATVAPQDMPHNVQVSYYSL